MNHLVMTLRIALPSRDGAPCDKDVDPEPHDEMEARSFRPVHVIPRDFHQDPYRVFSEIRASVDGLGQAILYASLKLKDPVADAGPASSHQHCGRDIHKSENYHQDHHQAGKLLRLWTAIP
jgi:hypothetical protein